MSEDDLVRRLRAAGCVFAEDEAALLRAEAADPVALETTVSERVAGRPLEQILGWAAFARLRIVVEPGVFVPRRRTELLVDLAVQLAPPFPVVVDLCCGSGAVGAALAATIDPIELHAADLDPVAVHCARRNLGTAGRVHTGDLYAALPADLRGRVDLLVVNAPYVPTDAIELMPPEARDHEPTLALDGGRDGLVVQRRVVAGAGEWLGPGGRLLIETSAGQADQLAAAYERAGLTAEVVASVELDATVVIGSGGSVGRWGPELTP